MELPPAERERFADWVAKAHGALLRSARGRGVPYRDAEDIVQDSLIGVLAHWQEFDSFEKFFAYCLVRVRWRATDNWRKHSKETLESELSEQERTEILQRPDPQDSESTR